jgi:hypothetical protein
VYVSGKLASDRLFAAARSLLPAFDDDRRFAADARRVPLAAEFSATVRTEASAGLAWEDARETPAASATAAVHHERTVWRSRGGIRKEMK